MKIVQLSIKNTLGVTAVEITPEGNTIIISGPNAAGKTSILNSMWLALAGRDAIKANPDPIKHGENHATVIVQLGDGLDDNRDIIVTRTWTQTKTSLVIENSEGAVFKSPQAMLASLIGKLSFDPLEFSNQPEREQVETLLSLIDLSVDITELDRKRKELYDSRTIVNRDIKQLTGQRDGIEFDPETPNTELSSTAVMEEYQAASEKIKENNGKKTNLVLLQEKEKTTNAQLSYLNDEIARFQSEASKTKEELIQVNSEVTALNEEIEGLVDPDLEQFKTHLTRVESINEQVRKKQDREIVSAKLKEEQSNSEKISAEIQDIDTQKATVIQEANMPVEGLGFNEDGVLYNEVPLKQCSSAEQLRVSLAMAMALNPKLRVIRITDGSLLDSANMALIEEMAQAEDFQVWVEKVDESGTLGVYIEEGEVAMDNQTHLEEGKESKKTSKKMPPLKEPRSNTKTAIRCKRLKCK